LTPAFRSRSASSRRRTGATPPKQPPRLTSRERSTYHKDSSASDGRKNTPLSLPLFLLTATNSSRKKFTSPAKRIVTTVRAAEKTSTSVKNAGQYHFQSTSIAFRLQSRPPLLEELHYRSKRLDKRLVFWFEICNAFLFSFVDTVTHRLLFSSLI
jgi:hypothetical protein